MVKFWVRKQFSDGGLKLRMEEEGLPSVLMLRHANKGRIERIEYSCSEPLAFALLRAGADLEITVWSDKLLEYKRTGVDNG